ncbi:1,4-alpha-glucan branching enzyme, partial [Streptomyces ipomoeae 91-03]
PQPQPPELSGGPGQENAAALFAAATKTPPSVTVHVWQ